MSDEIISKQVRDYAQETMTYLFEAGCNEMKNFMSIMETNDGRNKVFGLVQYCIMLYVKCMSSENQTVNLHRVLKDPHLETLIEREGCLPQVFFTTPYNGPFKRDDMLLKSDDGRPDWLNSYFRRIVQKENQVE